MNASGDREPEIKLSAVTKGPSYLLDGISNPALVSESLFYWLQDLRVTQSPGPREVDGGRGWEADGGRITRSSGNNEWVTCSHPTTSLAPHALRIP